MDLLIKNMEMPKGWYHYHIDPYISEREQSMIDMIDSLVERYA